MPDTLASVSISEIIIKKSRFLGRVEPIRNRTEAGKVVEGLWREHPTATHVCWALMAGGQSAANDDGEPSGTAGRPMLEVLRHQKLEGVLATVVRYYGGINLGAGGLVRAYTDAVAQALKNATKVPIVSMKRVACALPYALEGMLRNRIAHAGIRVISSEKGMDLRMTLEGPEDVVDRLMEGLSESSQGRMLWVLL